MKPGPVLAMVALIFVGIWLVLYPALKRERYEFATSAGAVEMLWERTESGGYRFVEPEGLAAKGELSADGLLAEMAAQRDAWDARPEADRKLLGFFNITSWLNFGWVAVGLAGQIAFFGRMMVQWVVSESRRESVVPELFWWLSFAGGVCLFTYFVWRKDFVGVLGQSTGVVIYARNLRLIQKQKRRAMKAEADGEKEGQADARAAG